MAMAARAERAPVVRTRVHADGAPARPMVRATAGVSAGPAERQLALVPRRRRAASVVVLIVAFVFGSMLAAAAFQTQLARRQLTLDHLDRDIRSGQEQYSELRRERAELRSPGRLAAAASALGMQPTTRTEFMVLSPEVIAAVQQSAGGVFEPGVVSDDTAFDQFKTVKSVAGGAP